MLKKIALGALLTGLVAVLIVGAVNRTNAVGAQDTYETGRWAQQGAANEASGLGGGQGRGAGGNGAGGGQGQGAGGNGAGGGQGAGQSGGTPAADVQPDEWRSVEGTVVAVAADLVEIESAAGDVIPFEGRPLAYALEQGLTLAVGDAVTLQGFDEDSEFKIGTVTHLASGATVTLRDASGRPGWAGQGWRE